MGIYARKDGKFTLTKCQECLSNGSTGSTIYDTREEAVAAQKAHRATHFPCPTKIFGSRPTTWATKEPSKTRDAGIVQTRGNRRMKASGR